MKLSTVLISAMAVSVLVSGCGKGSVQKQENSEVSQKIKVSTTNQEPVANNVSVKTLSTNKMTYTLTATDPDNDPIEYEVVSNPKHGKLVSFNKKNGTFIYEPDSGYEGTDKFTYSVSDGNLKCQTKSVTIEVEDKSAAQNITLPNAPSNLKADEVSKCNSVDISWSDNSDNEDGFEIYIERYDEDGDLVEEDSWLEMVVDKDTTNTTIL